MNVDDANSPKATPVTPHNLTALGYKIYPGTPIGTEKRFFQKAFSDADGRLYFLNFNEYVMPQETAYSAQLACDTDTGGYVWITIREASIERTEERAKALWETVGRVRYDSR